MVVQWVRQRGAFRPLVQRGIVDLDDVPGHDVAAEYVEASIRTERARRKPDVAAAPDPPTLPPPMTWIRQDASTKPAEYARAVGSASPLVH